MHSPTLTRHVFRTSRLAEFCSLKELVNQTGHAFEDWPLVALKELLDNALDACEEAGAAPCVEIEVSHDRISIADNGPGLMSETVAGFLATPPASHRVRPMEQARLAERYDIGIMLSKSMSVTAARQLADHICSRYNIPLLILRDFDISGFSIARTVGANTRQYRFQNQIKVIELGLRLADVEEMNLESETVSLGSVSREKIRRLRRNGAANDEITFLLGGERVELNAMASDVFVAFVERKLAEHGFAKVIPASGPLEKAFRLFARGERIRQSIEDTIKGLAAEEIPVPTDLDCRVRTYLAENPEEPWSAAVRHIVNAVGRAR